MVNAYIALIPNNLVRLWCAGNNGQRSQTNNTNYIGPWATGELLGNINSAKLAESCDRNAWVAWGKHSIPKNRAIQNLSTLFSNDGHPARQIDYVLNIKDIEIR